MNKNWVLDVQPYVSNHSSILKISIIKKILFYLIDGSAVQNAEIRSKGVLKY